MGYMTIDGRKVEFTDEPNVLSVIRNADIDIPTLCYHSELSVYGACRLCTVEDERGKTFASCSEPPRDGMVIYTNTPRLMKYRKMILELLLAAHCRDCTTCIKSENVSFRRWHTVWASQPSDLKIQKNSIHWISVHRQSCVTRINVFSVVTVSVCATMYSLLMRLILHTGEQRLW